MEIKDLIESSKKLVLDTGIYIEYFKTREDPIKKFLRETIFIDNSEVKLFTNYIIMSEIYYILCRSLGKQKARELLNEIELYLIIENQKKIYELAGQIKCIFSISLADCYSIATGLIQSCPILFFEEAEISREIVGKINEQFKSELYILDKDIFL